MPWVYSQADVSNNIVFLLMHYTMKKKTHYGSCSVERSTDTPVTNPKRL